MAHKDNYKDILDAMAREGQSRFDPEEEEVFASWLNRIKETGVPFLVGGAFAVHAYTGIWRDTKDLDIFIRPKDLKILLDVFASAGVQTEITYRHWLAKVRRPPYFMDLIFGVWNGRIAVDDEWFKRGQEYELAGVAVKLIPLEEMFTTKLYVAARDRFDGSDIVHLIRCTKGQIDWARVLQFLDGNAELLLWHLIFFDFVYPGHSDYLPKHLMVQLFEKARERWSLPKDPKAFRGTLLDHFSFEVDIKDWGYHESRDMEPLVDRGGDLLCEESS